MVFNLEQTAIFQSLKLEKYPVFKYAGFLYKLFLGLIVFSIFLAPFSINLALGFLIIFLSIFIFLWHINLFFNLKVKNPEPEAEISEALLKPKNYNLAEFLDFEAAKIVWQSMKFCRQRKISNIPSSALLYFSLKESQRINFIFLRLGLNGLDILEKTKNYLEKSERKKRSVEVFSSDFKKTIITAAKISKKRKKAKIGSREILIALLKHDSFFKDILVNTDIKEEDVENVVLWSEFLENRIAARKKFWAEENLAQHGSLAKDWASGYTITLDKFSIDWRKAAKTWIFKAIVGHEKEISRTERILVNPKNNNVLLVGEPGVGRKSIIEALAHRAFTGTSFPELNFQRVVELDMVSLLSQISDPEEAEAILDKIFQEVVLAGNVILVINDFHKYVALKIQTPGAIDISGIIAKYLQFPQFRFIGITDYAGLHKKIEQNPSLFSLLNKVEVAELSELETIRVLKNKTLELEAKYKIFVTYPAIREIINLTGRYLPSQFFPEKAISILEEAVVYVATDLKGKVVLPFHIAKIISEKTEIPVGEAEVKEKETLLNLEKLIHQRIINQEEAVKEISTAMRRARAGIVSKKRPMGTFLFLGPTGVGKTETSKALAEIYFRGEGKMIRLDMSEFQEISDIQRLIGSSDQEGLLTTKVRESPFSLVLLDEIEKAHPNILNLFLQVFDEGNITDGQGRKTSFANTIIICTSNAGAPIIFSDMKLDKKLDIIKDDLLDYFFKEGIFRPEFINRYDAVVVFKPLSKENLLDIAELMLLSLQKNLQEKKIEFLITKPLKEKIVEISYNPAFGAREMRRVIQDKVENVLAQALLSDQIKKGDKVTVEPIEFKLVINS